MSTPPDPLAAALRDALDSERSGGDDDALIARAIARATARVSATAAGVSASVDADGPRAVAAVPPAPRSSSRVVELASRSRRTRAVRIALPVAAAFAASVAFASVYLASRSTAIPPAPPSETPEVPPATPAEPRGHAATISPGEVPSISVNDLPSSKPSAAVTSHAWVPPSPAADNPVTAAELFRDANAERRGGNVGKAVDLYSSLQKRFPDSSETHASRVSLGRLLLDRQGDAKGALAQFDAYLQGNASDGTLSEEARLGRALAFQRLGQPTAETTAWQELLARHPQSLHTSRAKERLQALAGAAGETR